MPNHTPCTWCQAGWLIVLTGQYDRSATRFRHQDEPAGGASAPVCQSGGTVVSHNRRRKNCQSHVQAKPIWLASGAMHSAQQPPKRLVSLRHVSSLGCALGVLCWGLFNFVGPKNADWLAYQYLFEDAGGWLANAGRDPSFLALLSFSAYGTDYDGFRTIVGLYFVVFSWWLIARWKQFAVVDRYVLSYLTVLPLLLPRFTVQIREGIAITLVLAAITILWRKEATGRRGRIAALALTGAATSFHGGAAVFLAMMLVPWTWRFLFGSGARATSVVAVVIGAVAFGVSAATGLFDAIMVGVVQLVWGGFVTLETETGGAKSAYWLARCAAAGYLAYVARAVIARSPQSIAGFLNFGTCIVLPLLHLLVLYLVFGGHSAYLSSAGIRMLNMVMLLLLAIIGFCARKSWPLIGLTLFMLVDQVRVLLDNAPDAG